VFKVSGGRELEASLDGYNLTNSNYVWEVRTVTGRLTGREGGLPTGAPFNQPQFLAPSQILNPRILRLGLTFRF
jgi:hypothetical protein